MKHIIMGGLFLLFSGELALAQETLSVSPFNHGSECVADNRSSPCEEWYTCREPRDGETVTVECVCSVTLSVSKSLPPTWFWSETVLGSSEHNGALGAKAEARGICNFLVAQEFNKAGIEAQIYDRQFFCSDPSFCMYHSDSPND